MLPIGKGIQILPYIVLLPPILYCISCNIAVDNRKRRVKGDQPTKGNEKGEQVTEGEWRMIE